MKKLRYKSGTVPEVAAYIGTAYFHNEYWEQALEYLRKEEELNPDTMHSNYYLIAYCYYRMKEEKLTFTYLVRGAVFSSSSLKKEEPILSPFETDEHFYELAKDIFLKIKVEKSIQWNTSTNKAIIKLKVKVKFF